MTFPIQIPDIKLLHEFQSHESHSYNLCSFMTDGFEQKARRLFESCKKFDVSCKIFKVPSVHRSISEMGGQDRAYTKQNFIHFLLDKYNQPVFYLDCDCYLMDKPERIEELVVRDVDFAAYNWLADKQSHAYTPVTIKVQGDEHKDHLYENRFYVRSHNVKEYSTEALINSGAVMYFGNTDKSRAILCAWEEATLKFPNSIDDQCLDHAYNYHALQNIKPKSFWFGKRYARYAWWPHIKPVVNHPDFPHSNTSYDEIPRNLRWPDTWQRKNSRGVFPRGVLIDVQEKMLYEIHEGQLKKLDKISIPLWIADADKAV